MVKAIATEDTQYFHVRATITSLSGVTTTGNTITTKNAATKVSTTTNTISAYASFFSRPSPLDDRYVRTNVTSMPLREVSAKKHMAKWEKPNMEEKNSPDAIEINEVGKDVLGKKKKKQGSLDVDAKKSTCSSAITYVLLKSESEKVSSDATSAGSLSTSLAPELIHLDVGLSRGEDKIHLGVVTLVISGEVENQRLALPVRKGESLRKQNNKLPPLSTKKKKGLFKLLSSKNNSKNFSNDPRIFGIENNAILRVSIDVSRANLERDRLRHIGNRRVKNTHVSPKGFYDGKTPIRESRLLGIDIWKDAAGECIEVIDDESGTTIIPAVPSAPTQNAGSKKAPSDGSKFDISYITTSTSPTTKFPKEDPSVLTFDDKDGGLNRRLRNNLLAQMSNGLCVMQGCGHFDDDQTYRTCESTASNDDDNMMIESRILNRYNTATDTTNNSSEIGENDETSDTAETPDHSTYSDDLNTVSVGSDTIQSLQAATETIRRHASRIGIHAGDILDDFQSYSKSIDGASTIDEATLENESILSNSLNSGTFDDTLESNTFNDCDSSILSQNTGSILSSTIDPLKYVPRSASF